MDTMLLFLVKKAFFDAWDNFLPLVLMNLGFVALLAFPLLVPFALSDLGPLVFFPLMAIGILMLFVYTGAVSLAARDIVNYTNPEFKRFFTYLRESWKSSLVLGGIFVGHIAVIMVAFPVYTAMENILGLAALIFLFWASVIWLVSSQFFFPIRAQLDTKVGKILKKCFIVFFDNTGFALFLALGSLVNLVVSALTAFLIPGIAGWMVWLQAGLKLRLLKYDYLEENPDANRRKIPWDALLIDEKDRVGSRSIRGMIFPWKD